jgi:nucleotide-binding universal stress UspA family protein
MSGPLLCAVDLTDLAGRAVLFAATLAHATGSSITLFHATERGDGEIDSTCLAALAGPLLEAGLTVRTEFAAGDPATAIVRRAEALRASAIVMGTHGGRGLERLMLGSVAESVLHRAGRPVATVRGPEHAGGPIKRIVCGADLEDSAPLRHAAALAHRIGAELLVVHAVEDLPEEGAHGLVPSSYRPALLEEARASLDRAVAGLDLSSKRVSTRIVPGPASRALLRCADGESADLLVVGVRPHVLGSTTHPIVRRATCPVLTVPGGAGGEEIA